MVKIDILMATYNGSEYIEGQILSLIGQTFKDWKLIVHDDGSNDDTVSIIKKYEQEDGRITVIDDGIKFGNAGSNFLHLLQFSTSEYIIFCDQDDIWFETKLEYLYLKIKKLNSDKPVGVYSSGYLYSRELGISGVIPTLKPRKIEDVLFLNAGVQGCAILFNDRCRDLMVRYEGYISMHDHLLTMVLVILGEINYTNAKLMMYRQFHANKVTDNIEVDGFKLFKKRLFSNTPILDKHHYLLIRDFYVTYESYLSIEQKNIYNIFNNIFRNRNNKIQLIVLILQGRFNIGNSKLKLIVKAFFRPLLY